jgi:hypothetical protein
LFQTDYRALGDFNEKYFIMRAVGDHISLIRIGSDRTDAESSINGHTFLDQRQGNRNASTESRSYARENV